MRRLISVGSLILVLGAIVGTGVYYGPLIVEFGGVSALTNRLAFENVLHAHGFHYYFWQLPLGLLPAGIALPWMMIALRRPDPVPRTCALAVAIGVVIFSLSSSKQSHYLLPLYPLVAVWAGRSSVFEGWSTKTVVATAIPLAVLLLGLEFVSQMDSGARTDVVMGRFAGEYWARRSPIAQMERHPVLAYYLDRPDLEIVEGADAARDFIEQRRGFVVADLERARSSRRF